MFISELLNEQSKFVLFELIDLKNFEFSVSIKSGHHLRSLYQKYVLHDNSTKNFFPHPVINIIYFRI